MYNACGGSIFLEGGVYAIYTHIGIEVLVHQFFEPIYIYFMKTVATMTLPIRLHNMPNQPFQA